jgi:hypothetical protein
MNSVPGKPEHFLAFTAIAATLICHRRPAK